MIPRGRATVGAGRLGQRGRGGSTFTTSRSERLFGLGKVAFIDVLKRWAMLSAILGLRKCVVSDADSCEGGETTLQTIASTVP
ncbi:MAG: hypothetical protein GY880_06840 [Planctomycetaceae bacterium]|nr:hypothetical protein [Planctomycetaceae bacterium]